MAARILAVAAPAAGPAPLVVPPAPVLGPPPPDLERPYFQRDPLLDPPQWPQPGWFSDVQLGVIHPQIFFGQMKHSRGDADRQADHRGAGRCPAGLDGCPRLEVGYRLPSGFGGFSFSDRFFSTSGTGPFIGPAGSTTRTTNLGVNYSDWDYTSREYTPWANWEMECAPASDWPKPGSQPD